MGRLLALAVLALAVLALAAGGLPRTGIEVLQLALLGIALLLGGARFRVLVLRRKRSSPERSRGGPAPPRRVAPAPSRRAARPPSRHAARAPSRRAVARDEWAFPDPSRPAPTGLLPSTASARRRARALALSGDPD